ncbi:hypothetical protein G3576_00550 [Roseomonas stagni]|uniref:Uncharacterized protein n=1 Tax=Falsiroseomonas algicola TaxID=2716930 RepID=A0A6M1LE88_9PROT|nr:hypothetical protein [Falsiroseomonas algicola]NGM18482.1 hypothetical protein [Falsiroseomonas algicola]
MRSLGLILCAAAVAIAAGFGPLYSLAGVMVALYPRSLRMLQAAVDQNISARLWDRVLLPVLSWPAWIFPAVIGVALLYWVGRQAEKGHG